MPRIFAKIDTQAFFGSLNTNFTPNFEIQNGESNMADKNVKIDLIVIKFTARRFSRYLISKNQNFKLENGGANMAD